MDYTPECLQRVLEEFDYFYVAQARGTKQRVKLVEAFFREVLSRNAQTPQEPPLDYKLMKGVVKTILYAQGLPAIPVPDHQHYLDTQGGAYAGGFDVHVERQAVPTTPTVPRGRRGDGGGGRGGRGAGAGDGASGLRAPAGGNMSTEKVGRYPRNFKLAVTGAGLRVCMGYQQRRCTRPVDQAKGGCKLGSGFMVHVCGCILEIHANGLKLCEGNHCFEDCKMKQ